MTAFEAFDAPIEPPAYQRSAAIPANLQPVLRAEGYTDARVLATGDVAALSQFIFTVGLLVGIDEVGYRTRFCYPDAKSAREALMSWDGRGDPPGPWVKEKGGVERCNPRLAGIPIVVQAGARGR